MSESCRLRDSKNRGSTRPAIARSDGQSNAVAPFSQFPFWLAYTTNTPGYDFRKGHLVDFRDPDLPERLDIYRSLSHLTAVVRQHLGWDNHNPLRRFALRADLMADPKWLKGTGADEIYYQGA